MARAVNLICHGRKYLALPPATGELPDFGGVVHCSPAAPYAKPIEHAGHAYQERLRQAYCTDAAKAEDVAFASAAAKKQSAGDKKAGTPKGASGTELQRKLATDGDDLYALLELGDKRWHATGDEIKKAFRRISLLYHPDKLRHKVSHLGEEAIAETESHFKKVMKAYDILSNKKKRAAYDSIDDVDDTIPDEDEVTDKNFYELFGDCFALNARWAVSDRVPRLGEDDAPMDDVHKFYNFWYSFKTWRDFSFDLEYDTDQAECREEKRWMERQNSKRIKARKLEESSRIRQLTDLAYKKDPRIRREKDSIKQKKEALKEARRQQREEEEIRKREEEEKSRLEEERRVNDEKEKKAKAKRDKDAARKQMRKARQKLRAVARKLDLSDVTALTAIEKMCSAGDVRTIEEFAEKLTQISPGQNKESSEVPGLSIANITDIVEDALANGVQTSIVGYCLSNGPAQRSLATEGVGGSQKEIHGVVGDQSMTPNGNTEVAPKPHEKSLGANSHDSVRSKMTAWSQEEMSLLSKGLGKFPGGTKNRWERLAHYVGTRSEQEVVMKVKAMRPAKLQKGKPVPNGSAKTASNVKHPKADPIKAKPMDGPKAQPSKTAPVAVSSQAKSKVPNKLMFTGKQQEDLEKALKKYASESKERKWVKVAGDVSGRSAQECEERFKELITYYRAKKSNTS